MHSAASRGGCALAVLLIPEQDGDSLRSFLKTLELFMSHAFEFF
jgi:hypothetical protein